MLLFNHLEIRKRSGKYLLLILDLRQRQSKLVLISFAKMNINKCVLKFLLCFLVLGTVHLLATSETDKTQDERVNADPIIIDVSWTTHDYDLHTIPTIQVVVNPLLARQFSPIYKQIFASVKQLNAEYIRYAAWFPYPKLGVAELDPPSGLFQCGNVGQDVSINLSCEQSGGVISKVDFASYGTSSGVCGQMKQGTCHAANSSDVVRLACLGKQTCSVPAAVDLFGDPCKFHLRISPVCNYFSSEITMNLFFAWKALFHSVQNRVYGEELAQN